VMKISIRSELKATRRGEFILLKVLILILNRPFFWVVRWKKGHIYIRKNAWGGF
jgi:hypothetical protein